jgi:hypothetical protein
MFYDGLAELCHGHHGSQSKDSYWFYSDEWCEGKLRWTPISEIDVEPLHSAVTGAIWMPFLIVALPTGFLWYRDRRRIPPGCCQGCGYNLTGNVSGICPECGAETTPEGHR